MSWRIRFEGLDFSSDDMTIEELGCVEKISDTPWSLLNPIKEIVAAKAFLTIALMRQGTPDDVIAKRLSTITLKEFKKAFDWEAEETSGEGTPEPEDESPLEIAPSSTPKLSRTAPRDFAGHQKRRGNKQSGTSSSS